MEFSKRQLLNIGYRSAKRVTETANDILKLRKALVRSANYTGQARSIKSVEGNIAGKVSWLYMEDANNREKLATLNQEAQCALDKCAVLIPDAKLREESKKVLPDAMLYTPKEAKGLEFTKIFCFISGNYYANFLTEQALKEVDITNTKLTGTTKRTKNEDGIKQVQFWNGLFVGVTRAAESVYFVEERIDKAEAFKKHIAGIIWKVDKIVFQPILR